VDNIHNFSLIHRRLTSHLRS